MFFVHPRNKTFAIKFEPRMVSLTCKAVEAFSYIWERKIGRIPHNTAGVNTSTLTFTNIQFQDAGYYRCKAVNDAGESYSTFAQIKITGTVYFLAIVVFYFVYACVCVCVCVCARVCARVCAGAYIALLNNETRLSKFPSCLIQF